MPLYEYECPKHGRIEVEQRIVEDALQICPRKNCRKPVQRLISRSDFALKGSGFYSNDYGGKTHGS